MSALTLLDQTLRPGSDVGRYTVEQVLGEGGTAIVYRVRHRKLGTQYALKLLHHRSARLQERLLREARVQSSLQHPHIVHVLDVIEHRGQPGVVMELVNGPTLEQLLAHQRLELAQVDRLVEHILGAVERAHNQGIIHRDLKPANILLCPRAGTLIAKVCDFGLAKSDTTSTTSSRTGALMGTPKYMSPEQIRDAKRVDARTDVFALGVILYEMVTGTHPFDGGKDAWATLQRVSAGIYPPLDDAGLPLRMKRAIEGALVANVADRCASVSDLRALWNGDSQCYDLGWEDDLLKTARQLAPSGPEEPLFDAPVTLPPPTLTPPPHLLLAAGGIPLFVVAMAMLIWVVG